MCQIDALLAARESLNLSLAGTGKLSVNDFIVKAAALACKKVPAVNASWMGDFIRQYHNVDVNVAVNSPAGLMVPFVRDADKKGLLAISNEVKELAAKVCDKRGDGCRLFLSERVWGRCSSIVHAVWQIRKADRRYTGMSQLC